MDDSCAAPYELTANDSALLAKICISVNKSRFGGRRDYQEFLGAAWRGWHEAKQKFDPSRNTLFSTFAASFIRGRIMDEIRKEMPYSRSTYGLLCDYHALRDQGSSRPEAIRQVTEGLVPASRFAFMSALMDADQRSNQTEDELSVDPLANVADASLPDVVEQIQREQVRKALLHAMTTQLSWLERQVLSCVYNDGWLMKEVGRNMELSESRVSQIARQGLDKLRGSMGDFMGQ